MLSDNFPDDQFFPIKSTVLENSDFGAAFRRFSPENLLRNSSEAKFLQSKPHSRKTGSVTTLRKMLGDTLFVSIGKEPKNFEISSAQRKKTQRNLLLKR